MGALCVETAVDSEDQLPEIIVTAQKEERLQGEVGMSITADTGETLRRRGIDTLADLPQLVPGLTLQEGAFNSSSFTLRGVGFNNSDLDSPPAVTVYVDEAPLPFPAMTKLAAFDLDRVEVLKGPQGTLFGENATGGAVNYIAAKPTTELSSGVDVSDGTFNRIRVGGFLSGPVDDYLTGRVAVQFRRGDAWQESVTRPGDRLGSILEVQSRGTLEWRSNTKITSRLTVTFTHDGSDTEAGQFIAPFSNIPALAIPSLFTFPVVTSLRAADWASVRPDTDMPFSYRSNSNLYQTNWRNDYAPGENVTFSSLTSYSYFSMKYGQATSGTPYELGSLAIDQKGRVSTLFQELRLAQTFARWQWLAGANYEGDNVFDEPLQFFADSDVSHLFEAVDPHAVADESEFMGRLRARTYAAFGRIEFHASDALRFEGSVRYNVDRRAFDNCAYAVTQSLAQFWNLFRGGAQPPTEVGDCYVLDSTNGLRPVSDVHNTLDQDSLPWKVGATWSFAPDFMSYANVSRGFKAGAVAVLAASTTSELTPLRQESLVAYETGVKAGLFDHRVQVNASVFYYDYKDKQLRGSELDPTFGPLQALVSIPKSHVEGSEVQWVARPVRGLTVDVGVTHLETKIDQFTGFNALAEYGNQAGTAFPFSPKWQAVTNIDYEAPISGGMKGFIGATDTYNSKTFAGVGASDILRIDAFSLLNLRVGMEIDDSRYRIWAWGKNVTNRYYWSDVMADTNAVSRFVGQPATFGLSLSARL